jgi:hypothetical protein
LSTDVNALLAVCLEAGKEFGKQKAKAAVPGTGDHAGLNKGALASIAAAAGGALWIWRKKSDETRGT